MLESILDVTKAFVELTVLIFKGVIYPLTSYNNSIKETKIATKFPHNFGTLEEYQKYCEFMKNRKGK